MKCRLCRNDSTISEAMPYCPDCIRGRFEEIEEHIAKTHGATRKAYGLPETVPEYGAGVRCQLCVNRCSIGDGDFGYCGVRQNVKGKLIGPDREWAYVDWYHDPLPTNCVADWVCEGSKQLGYTNLAVFYEACTFNCLFCQNWHFRDRKNRAKTEELVRAAYATTGCICFFGGDPTPFALNSLEVAARLKDKRRNFRICWETNGSIAPEYMKKWAGFALASNGCIKIDLKAYSEKLNFALCGTSNENTKRNIEAVAWYMEKRVKLPVLIVSTLLIPGYIDEAELNAMAEFISAINKDIPWSFLGFHPHFRFEDMPCTTRRQADTALSIAKAHGIKNTHLGNIHLLQ